MLFLKLALLISLYCVSCLAEQSSLLEAIYWEVKPYVFTNKDGEIDGIIPRIFEEGQNYCMKRTNVSSKHLLKFVRKEPSRKSFYNLVRSHVNYGHHQLKNVSKTKALWFPVLSSTKGTDSFIIEKGVASFQVMKSDYLVVIVPRSYISLPTKILRGIFSCQQILFISLLLSVLFGIVVWAVERSSNDDFQKSFIKGSMTAFWWSVVSMTTVGYGDIVPRSFVGRLLGIIWVFIGVMMACVITATTTEAVTGSLGLSVHGKTVSVLENSYEEKIAIENYGTKTIPAQSYEDVIDLVRQNKVFAAMISADVAVWYQDEIHNDSSHNPLSIVNKLPANLYVNLLMCSKASSAVKNIMNCMYHLKDEVYVRPTEMYQRYVNIEHLYIESMAEMIRNNVFVQVILGLICGLLLLGITFDIVNNTYYNFNGVKSNTSKGDVVMACLVGK